MGKSGLQYINNMILLV